MNVAKIEDGNQPADLRDHREAVMGRQPAEDLRQLQNIQSEVERLWKIHNIQAELEMERLEKQEQEDMLCSSQLSCLNYRGLLASALLSFHTTLGRNSEPGWSKYFFLTKNKNMLQFHKIRNAVQLP